MQKAELPQMRRIVVGRHAGEHPARALILGFVAAGRGRRGIDGQSMACNGDELPIVTRRSIARGLGLDARLVGRLVAELLTSCDLIENGEGLDAAADRLGYRWKEGQRLDYALPLRSSPNAELLAAAIRAMPRRRTARCEPYLAKLLGLSEHQIARAMRRAVTDGLVVRRLSGGRWWTIADPLVIEARRSAPPVLQKRTPDDAKAPPGWCNFAPHHQEVRTAGLPDYAPLRLVDASTTDATEQQPRLRRDDPTVPPAVLPEPDKGQVVPFAKGPIPPGGAPTAPESHDDESHTRWRPTYTETADLERRAADARSSWSAFDGLLAEAVNRLPADDRSADAWFCVLTVLGVFVADGAVSPSGLMGHRRKRRELAEEMARRAESASFALEFAALQARDLQATKQPPSAIAAKFTTTVQERSDAFRERSRQRTAEGLPPLPHSVELTRLVQPQMRPFALRHALPLHEQQRIDDAAAVAQKVGAVKAAAQLGGQVAAQRAVAHFRDDALVSRQRAALRDALAKRDGEGCSRIVQRLVRLGVDPDELRAEVAAVGLLPAARTGTA